MAKLAEFTLSAKALVEPAFLKFAGPERQLHETEQPLLLAYAAYGYADKHGDRAIDIFLREHRGELRAAEIEALEALQQTAWPSVFEVREVELDRGMHLVDLVAGETTFIRERAATHHVKKYDLILAWLVALGDHVEMTGAAGIVPRIHRDPVLKAITKELGRLRKKSDLPTRVLLREAIVAGHKALGKALANWQPPHMVTMDGEEIVFCEALFDVTDLAAAKAKLSAHPDIDQDDAAFIWVDRNGRAKFGPGPLHLGTIRFVNGRMKLETKSRERLERGKRLLGDYLAGVTRHRIDSIKDLDVALAEYQDRAPEASREEIPDDVQAQLLSSYMQEHIDSWVDERLPALNGKTPRQAVRTKAGRQRVVDMLKDQENTTLSQPWGAAVDFANVYRELGLERE